MANAKVIVLDDLAPEGLAMLDAAEGIDYEVRTGLKGEELREALAAADGAICRSGVKLTPDVFEGNRRLKAVVRAGVGTDNIDKPAATRLGVIVMNTPDGNTISTAEHTLAMMMALSRNIAPAHQSLVEGRWDRKKYMGAQLAGKTLGVVGLGRIGQAVAARARALEMRVIGFDPFLSKERAEQLGIDAVEKVEELWPLIDYLTVHTPLTDQTKDLVDEAALEQMRPGVRLINCARGGIYNEDALVSGLKSGKIAGVALDVYANEPCTESPLFGMPGVLATPHLGASTEEAQTQVAVEAVELLVDYLTKGAIKNAVNTASLDPKTLEALRGFLDVAYRLGRLQSQLNPSGIRNCRLTYRGDLAERNTKLLSASFAAGLLEGAMNEEANIINAEVLLRERGIQLDEDSRRDKGAFSSVMIAEVTTDNASTNASGTLFGKHMARLVELAGHRLEAYLDGCLLVFHHQDVPGIIGTIGTILGNHQVNIAQMAVGRTDQGQDAVGVLNLDSEPAQAALDEVLQHPAIRSAHVIRLPAAGEMPSWLQG
ncbi:MAG: phosphoglycerate dehydrogenase [Planctomycetales bacterium]|nr:phosphoglycerate dehydrogenase [Planctomycetales bacterium]